MMKSTMFVLFLALSLGMFSGLFGQIYTQDFSSTFPPSNWALYDAGIANNWSLYTRSSDNYAYNGDYCMQYVYKPPFPAVDANAWAFTQGVAMTAGNTYRIEFQQRVTSSMYPENMKVTVGNAQTVAAQGTTLLDLPSLTNTSYTNRVSANFTPAASGTYFFGFNCYSAASVFTHTLYIDNVRIYEEGSTPVELSSFTVTLSNTNHVMLTWVTQSETNVAGFALYRGTNNELGEAMDLGVFIEATNTSQMQTYVYHDTEVWESGTYYYWLENRDLDGTNQIHGPVYIVLEQSGQSVPPIPLVTGINNVYPNPFNPSATINYSLEIQEQVELLIYNTRGQVIRRLLQEAKQPGHYQIVWNGVDESGTACSSGIYNVVLRVGNRIFQRKAVLLK